MSQAKEERKHQIDGKGQLSIEVSCLLAFLCKLHVASPQRVASQNYEQYSSEINHSASSPEMKSGFSLETVFPLKLLQ